MMTSNTYPPVGGGIRRNVCPTINFFILFADQVHSRFVDKNLGFQKKEDHNDEHI